MASESYFYVGPDRKTVGPYTLSQLQGLAAQGVIKPTTKAIRKGDRQWVPYSQLATAPRLPARRLPALPEPRGQERMLKGLDMCQKDNLLRKCWPGSIARKLNRERLRSR